MKEILVFFVLFISLREPLASSEPNTEFSFASYYETNMVLQAAPARAVIWGFAPSEDIGSIVYLNLTNAFLLRQYKTYVKEGPSKDIAVWKVTLDPVETVQPFSVIAALKQYKTLLLENVLFGDVWFCSGQSNMKFPMSMIINSSEEIKEAVKFSQIRFFSVAQVQSLTPLIDIKSIEIHWSVPNEEDIKQFSAVCWLFAKHIFEQRGLPIGLVESSWGGTAIEAWASPECLKSCGIKPHSDQIVNVTSSGRTREFTQALGALSLEDGLDYILRKVKEINQESAENLFSNDLIDLPHSSLWNAMVYPILNMTIFGALWYQGEANANVNVNQYNCTLPTMIGDWRRNWYGGTTGQTDLSYPFGVVQLGPTSGPSIIAGFPDVRWHQTADVGFLPNKKMPNTFLAVAYDLADPVGGIHFRDKLTLSRRLALSGLAIAYGKTNIKYNGPFVTGYDLDTVKSLLIFEYDSGKSLITVKNKDGFEICCQSESTKSCSQSGKDWSTASIISYTNTTVSLSIAACHGKYLTGVRFEWRETPCKYREAPVYSVENELPAPPFIVNYLFGPVF